MITICPSSTPILLGQFHQNLTGMSQLVLENNLEHVNFLALLKNNVDV